MALAKHAQSHAERKRRFVSNWETNLLYGWNSSSINQMQPKCITASVVRSITTTGGVMTH